MCLYLLNVCIKKKCERCQGQTLARTYSQTASWDTDNVRSDSVFVCEENRSFLTISPSLLYKPPSSRGHVPFVQRTKRGSPALLCWPLWSDISLLPQPRWRKYADRRELADRYATKAKWTVRQIHVWGCAFTIYNACGFYHSIMATPYTSTGRPLHITQTFTRRTFGCEKLLFVATFFPSSNA